MEGLISVSSAVSDELRLVQHKNYADVSRSERVVQQYRRWEIEEVEEERRCLVRAVQQFQQICLDEAQMVEATTTKTAEMALKLHAINRWCVTGTPVQHTLDDLYGLLLFLGVKPFYMKNCWRALLYEPFCAGSRTALYDVVSRVMWRTCKADVVDEIGLRPIQEKLHKLQFLPVEEFFYRRQFENCRTQFLETLHKFSDWTTKLSSMDKQALKQLLLPLRQLLQACCHPQVVRGAFLPTQKRALSMEQVTQRMIKNTVTECEEHHRSFVHHANGLAGLYLLANEPMKAVEKYRAILSSAARYAEKDIRTDDLQLLHVVHNLRSSLQMVSPVGGGGGNGATGIGGEGAAGVCDESEQLKAKEEEIKKRYCEKAESALARSREALLKARDRVASCTEKLGTNTNWWLEVIAKSLKVGIGESLVEHVYESMRKTNHLSGSSVTMQKFRDARGMELVIESALKELAQSQACASVQLDWLDRLDPRSADGRQLVQATVDCCLLPALSGSQAASTCAFCVASELLSKYESRIFHFVDDRFGDLAESNSGDEVEPVESHRADFKRKCLWKESELEIMIKAIADFCRCDSSLITTIDPSIMEAGGCHLKLFEAWRAEFKLLRTLWMTLHQRVCSLDELGMATERLRLRTAANDDGEAAAAVAVAAERQELNVVDEWQVHPMISSTLADLSQEEWQLAKKMRHLQYLRHLAEGSIGKGMEPCPVCCTELSSCGWSMLTCGHHCCLACTYMMLGGSSGPCANNALFAALTGWRRPDHALQGWLKCPVCRSIIPSSDISLIQQPRGQTDRSCSDTESETLPRTIVKGSHSTKVEGIVRCLHKIILEEPGAKAIVFSTWTDMLYHVARALEDNAIRFVHHSSSTETWRGQLANFRENAAISVLLMPLSHGSKGLNIVEATHVLFAEPLFSPAQELQAVGRIHRIGQTRDTFVHHFTIENTVEEKLQAALKRLASDSTKHPELDSADEVPFTVQDLADMFDVGASSAVQSPSVGGNSAPAAAT